jgi:hypothetical protein
MMVLKIIKQKETIETQNRHETNKNIKINQEPKKIKKNKK